MIKSGLESYYGPHSTRAAATSKAKQVGVDIGTIIKTAGWSNAKTFAKFYDRQIEKASSVQHAVINHN